MAIQTTSASNAAARLTKARAEQRLRAWLASGARFEVWSWGKRAGKWEVRRVELVAAGLEARDLTPRPPRRRRRAACSIASRRRRRSAVPTPDEADLLDVPLLHPREAAAALNVSVAALRRMVRRGELPALRVALSRGCTPGTSAGCRAALPAAKI